MSLSRRYLVDLATSRRIDLGKDDLRALEERVNGIVSHDTRLKAYTAIGVASIIAGGWALGLSLMWVGRTAGLPRPASITAAGILTPLLLIGGWFVLFTPLLRGAVRRALRDLGHDVCASCGYVLEGLPRKVGQAVCPECGRRTQPPLGATAAHKNDP
ncbi:MAG: hypothetical protein NCW75_04895 [Phycisphaera sp.]|nr:MAG: hypothetical protein NCW75_04895 [Phycisphaera sp.]